MSLHRGGGLGWGEGITDPPALGMSVDLGASNQESWSHFNEGLESIKMEKQARK